MKSDGIGVPEFDLADRLRKALRESKVSVQHMADFLEVDRSTVSTWINGRIRPSGQTVRLFAMRTGVDYEWLKDGKSEREPNSPAGHDIKIGYRTRRRRHLAIVPTWGIDARPAA